jgi:hypothetical protein
MAEGMLGGILGEETEKPEFEAAETLAGADAFAAAVAAKLAGNDPGVARKTEIFLDKQAQMRAIAPHPRLSGSGITIPRTDISRYSMDSPKDIWHFDRPLLAEQYLGEFDLGLISARELFAKRRMGKSTLATLRSSN